MLSSKSSVLLFAVFITFVSLASSGVMVPREIPEDSPDVQEGPSGAAPEETTEPEDEDEGGNLLGRRRGGSPSFGNPPLGSNPDFEDGFGAMPPLKPDDYEVPDLIGPASRDDYGYNRRNPDRGDKGRGRPSFGREPSGGRRIPVNRFNPFDGKDDDEGPRIPTDGRGGDGRFRPFGGWPDIPYGEGPRKPTDENGGDRPFGGWDGDEGPGIPTDDEKKESDEDKHNEIDTEKDEDVDKDKESDEDTGDEAGKDEEKHDEEEKPDINEDEDKGSEEKGDESSDDNADHPPKDEEKDFDEEEKPGINEEEDKGSDEKGDESSDDDADHPPKDEEKDIDEAEAGIDQEEEKDSDNNPGNESDYQPLSGGFVFDTPFFNIRQVTKYFQQLERALEHVFRETVAEASALNGTYTNNTEEEVDIDGKKYVVHKSIIKSGDNSSSIMIEAISSLPASNDTKPAIEEVVRKVKVKTD